MEKKIAVLGFGVVAALVMSVLGLFNSDTIINPVEVRESPSVAAAPGPDHRMGVEYFYDGMADGGGCFATSTASSGTVDGTLTAAQMQRYNCFEVTVNSQSNMTLTLPATSTAQGVLPANGMHRSWFIHNATGTAAVTLTVAAGTGIDLIAETNAMDVIDGAEYSVLDCWRQTDTDWTCQTQELIAAD